MVKMSRLRRKRGKGSAAKNRKSRLGNSGNQVHMYSGADKHEYIQTNVPNSVEPNRYARVPRIPAAIRNSRPQSRAGYSSSRTGRNVEQTR